MKERILAILMAVMVGFGSLFCAPVAFALDDEACKDLDADVAQALGCSETRSAGSVVQNILNVAIAAVGIIAVFAIVISAIFMVTAAGDAGKVAKARKGVIYGIVGLLVAVLSWAIVNFVLSSVF